ncbi:MAG: G5 domain-containing protein, partial [Oscillospiraceae bacterium]|nr:G5 domain-containing protein [Oscillospiraceae bacterium]
MEKLNNAENITISFVEKFNYFLKYSAYPFVSIIGEQIINIFKYTLIALCDVVVILAVLVSPMLKVFKSTIAQHTGTFFKRIVKPVVDDFKSVKSVFAKIKAIVSKNGLKKAVPILCTKLAQKFKLDVAFRKTIFNYTLPVVCFAITLIIINYFSSMTFAIAVNYDGSHIGYIKNEGVFNEAQNIVDERIIVEDATRHEAGAPKFAVSLVDEQETVAQYALADAMIRLSSDDIVEASGLYVDDEFYGAVADDTQIREKLNSVLDSARRGGVDEKVEFVNDIQLREGLYIAQNIVDNTKLLSVLDSNKQNQQNYVLQSGDTPSGVAQKFSMAYRDLKALNPNIENDFKAGDTIRISAAKSFLSVKRTETITYNRTVAYTTVEEKSNTLYKGSKKIKTRGVNGQSEVTAQVEYIDGVEVSRTVLSEKVIKEPVNEVILIGQKKTSTSRPAGAANVKQSGFMWPVGGTGGYISSYMGDGRGHKGYDIAAPRGTPIYASKAGTVTMAKTYSGYGKCVIIDHGGGVQT